MRGLGLRFLGFSLGLGPSDLKTAVNSKDKAEPFLLATSVA